MKSLKAGQVFEHYKKGNLYEIITLAEDTETADLYVIYKQIPKNDNQEVDGKIWSRTIKMFTEDIEIDGKKIPRFKKV